LIRTEIYNASIPKKETVETEFKKYITDTTIDFDSLAKKRLILFKTKMQGFHKFLGGRLYVKMITSCTHECVHITEKDPTEADLFEVFEFAHDIGPSVYDIDYEYKSKESKESKESEKCMLKRQMHQYQTFDTTRKQLQGHRVLALLHKHNIYDTEYEKYADVLAVFEGRVSRAEIIRSITHKYPKHDMSLGDTRGYGEYRIGDQVMCEKHGTCVGDTKEMMPAVITHQILSMSCVKYSVKYENGDTEDNVSKSQIQRRIIDCTSKTLDDVLETKETDDGVLETKETDEIAETVNKKITVLPPA
jgi:hypothetical protein